MEWWRVFVHHKESEMHKKMVFWDKRRVLAKFQINLAIPKCYFVVIFQPGRGDKYVGELFNIFLVGEGEIYRELYSKVSSQYDEW